MANPYFSFKQFTVYHDRCAMKVGIDGVLLGAWVAVEGAKSILDIGTGTGLIALMLAQRANAAIDAIDVDTGAFEQAQFNVDASPWATRIKVHHRSLQDFSRPGKYELIVSNPPYFVNSLKAPDLSRSLARHTDSLTQQELLQGARSLLHPQGRFCVILPFVEGEQFISLAQTQGWCLAKKVEVFPMPHLAVKRLLIELKLDVCETITSKLVIEVDRHLYSDEFTAIVKDFYLKL